jgi:hypothetical protein
MNGAQVERLVGLTTDELWRTEMPEIEAILGQWLEEKVLVFLYANVNIGKTFLLMSIAYAVALGQDLFTWKSCGVPRDVVYLDPEMPAERLKKRSQRLAAGFGCEDDPNRNRIIWLNSETISPGMPLSLNLALVEHQELVKASLPVGALLIIDSFSICYRPETGDSNSEEWWEPMQEFLLELRRLGHSVIVAGHTNRTGDYSGTGAKLKVVDVVIRLKRPEGYKQTQGARFTISFKDKFRNGTGGAAEEVTAKLVDTNDALTWEDEGNKTSGTQPKKPAAEFVHSFVKGKGKKGCETKEVITAGKARNFPERTMQTALSDAVEAGTLLKRKRGHYIDPDFVDGEPNTGESADEPPESSANPNPQTASPEPTANRRTPLSLKGGGGGRLRAGGCEIGGEENGNSKLSVGSAQQSSVDQSSFSSSDSEN